MYDLLDFSFFSFPHRSFSSCILRSNFPHPRSFDSSFDLFHPLIVFTFDSTSSSRISITVCSSLCTRTSISMDADASRVEFEFRSLDFYFPLHHSRVRSRTTSTPRRQPLRASSQVNLPSTSSSRDATFPKTTQTLPKYNRAILSRYQYLLYYLFASSQVS